MLTAIRWIIAIAFSCQSLAWATDYHVGPDQAYMKIGDVPWESLSAGDTVLIHARPTPYAEKWVINRVGTEASPITVRGVPDAGGALPIIHGEGATTRSQLNYWNEERGILKIGGSNKPADGTPAYIVAENLHFRRARGAFTGRYGASTYADNAAAIYVEKGSHITVRNCVLEDNGNGLFVASATRDMVIEGNYIFGNGNAGSIYEHNTYTEARNILYQFNRFGPLCDGCGGNNLKDRSSGTVIRYNWIESGNRQLDLVDAEGSADLSNDPAYLQTFVYGNVLIEPDNAGNSQIVHFGGDSGNTAIYRGTLYFWNNTVVSTRAENTTLLRLSTNEQTADVRNNIIYVTAPGYRLALSNSAGTLRYGGNLFKPGFAASHSGLTGVVTDLGGNVAASSPGFVDEAGQEFHLLENSPGRNTAGTLPAAVAAYPLDREYLKHQAWLARPADALPDMGAFEYPTINTEMSLTVTLTGSGGGTVGSTPAGIACGAECTHQFDYGDQVTLRAEPAYSTFAGWSGDCSGTGDCRLAMVGVRNVIANFSKDTEHQARIGDTESYFPTLQAAYDSAPSGGTIKAWGTEFKEDLDCDHEKGVIIEGGYDTGYNNNVGFTLLNGTLTVSAGSLIVENLLIR
jgi:parallel beta-helix repeat protein